MGCYFAKVCSSEKEKKRCLVVEVSPYNTRGESIANSFIRYVQYKELALNAYVSKKEDIGNLICIKYTTYNDKKIIFNDTNLYPNQFQSIYQKIVVMNED